MDLDLIWKWLGFGKKSDCKSLPVNNFEENKDYKVSVGQDHKNFAAASAAAKLKALAKEEKIETRGGLNKETILLTVWCFKKLCFKAKTQKAVKYMNIRKLRRNYE